MSRLWVGIIAGAAGIFVGIQIAKIYAQQTVKGDISSALNAVHLGGGTIEKVADALLVPS
jgi:hypothetical protein